MGLDATVRCNCIKNGLSIPTEFQHAIILDSEGYYSLNLPYKGNEEIINRFDAWMASACTHEDMDLAFEHISNWSGLRKFQAILKSQPITEVSTLLLELPDTNSGLTSSSAAKNLLSELDKFEKLDNLGQKFVLVDSDTGDEVWEYVEVYAGQKILSGVENITLGVTPEGFFVKSKSGEYLFQSSRFEQNFIDDVQTLFTDLESGFSFSCSSRIGVPIPHKNGTWQDEKGQFNFNYPERLHTMYRDRKLREFDYIIIPLKRICTASIETGNPIRWV